MAKPSLILKLVIEVDALKERKWAFVLSPEWCKMKLINCRVFTKASGIDETKLFRVSEDLHWNLLYLHVSFVAVLEV